MEWPGVMMIAAILKISNCSMCVGYRGLSRSGSRQGFTLVELLLAIGLMGLILGLAMPRFGAVQSSFFSAEADRGLSNSVRAARMAAIRGRTTVALTVAYDSDNRLEERRLPLKEWPREESDHLAVEERDWSAVWEAPVVRSLVVKGSLELESSEPGIVFFPNGTSTGGRIIVTDVEEGSVSHFLVDPHTSELYFQ